MAGDTPIRVGIAGCGYQGNLFAAAIAGVEGMHLVACADPDLAAARHVAACCGNVVVFPSVDDMLGHAEVDAVLVATPHHLLCEVTLAAILAGKHVLIEKPVGVDSAEVARIECAAAAAGVCAAAGYSLRSVGAVSLVKQQIAAGAVGEITAIAGVMGTKPMDGSWAANPETGGGPLLYLGSYLVDLVLWFLEDRAVELVADVRVRPDTGADETSAFLVRFAHGAIAQCVVTQAADSFFHTMDIVGTQGHIRLWSQGFLNYAIEVVSQLHDHGHPTVIRPYVLVDGRHAMLVAELKSFADAVRARTAPSASLREACYVMEILDAVRASGARHAVVPVGIGASLG